MNTFLNDYGELVFTYKGKRYCGKSYITNKSLYRVIYTAYFYKDSQKILGSIQGVDFTFKKSFYKKSEMDKFLSSIKNGV